MQTEIKRDTPETEGALAARVKDLIDDVKADLSHWEDDFERMKNNRNFARGLQWPGMTVKDLKNNDRNYVENFTLRHLKQGTAATYARNPQFVWRRSQRLYHKLWDGTAESLNAAMVSLQSGQDMSGVSQAIIQEAMESKSHQMNLQRMGETLAICYQYFFREQVIPTKHMMKKMVMTSKVCGVGYVKQTFQRATQDDPEVTRQLADARSQLDTISQLSQDLEDEKIEKDDGRAQQLKDLIDNLEGQETIVLREGLALDFPDPINIIPSREMTYLFGFIGAPYVTEQYFLSPDKVKQIYGVDLGEKYRAYSPDDPNNNNGQRNRYSLSDASSKKGSDCVRVFEIWHKQDGLIYTVAEGYDDYLRKESPQPPTERFWPWFVYTPNSLEGPEAPFAPSDVELIEPMQCEVNRAGEAKRQHRFAARPGHVAIGQIDEQTLKAMQNRAAHQVVMAGNMPEGMRVADVLEAFPTNPIDPNLYETGSTFQGVLRVGGQQEANYGPTTGATATESSIAQSSRQSGDDSSIDELDDLLTEMARAGGQILLQELSTETVMEIVGPGAVWPETDRETVMKEVYLEVQAGSSGRKNQGQEVQVRTQLYPHMMQVPGLSQEWLLRDMLRTMDPTIVYEDAVSLGALSIVAQNGMEQASANAGEGSPEAQGPQGASNAPRAETGGQVGAQPPSEPNVMQ